VNCTFVFFDALCTDLLLAYSGLHYLCWLQQVLAMGETTVFSFSVLMYILQHSAYL